MMDKESIRSDRDVSKRDDGRIDFLKVRSQRQLETENGWTIGFFENSGRAVVISSRPITRRKK